MRQARAHLRLSAAAGRRQNRSSPTSFQIQITGFALSSGFSGGVPASGRA